MPPRRLSEIPASLRRLGAAALVMAVTGFASCGQPPGGREDAGTAAGAWLQYSHPSEAGFDSARLARACSYADSVRSAAVMAVYRGHVMAACGAVDRRLELHSVRKSLVSGLYGTAVDAGEIDLDATLGELGIDEDGKLTAAEEKATVQDVITARSGVYLPAAYAPESQDERRPERGSHPPGTFWYYNNWDFNVAQVIFERATGKDLYRAFDRRIARPIGMEDYLPSDGFRAYEPTLSIYPALTFRMSARDLARFGELYLQEGRWDGRQVIPADWVRRSTTPVSDLGGGAAMRVFRFRGDPYIHVPGRGEAKLIPLGHDRYTIRVVHGVDVAFRRDDSGAVTGVTLTLGGTTLRAARRMEG